MRAGAILALIIACISGASAGYWFLVRDEGDDVAAFFTVATLSVCSRGELKLDVARARFAAFLPGEQPVNGGDKFLTVQISLTNGGESAGPMNAANFVLSDRPGRSYAGISDAGASELTGTLEPGQSAFGAVTFSIPASIVAAKLSYDDGCTRHEWIVP